jgi:hypothetical protein
MLVWWWVVFGYMLDMVEERACIRGCGGCCVDEWVVWMIWREWYWGLWEGELKYEHGFGDGGGDEGLVRGGNGVAGYIIEALQELNRSSVLF